MIEKQIYISTIDVNPRKIFAHIHIPEDSTGKGVLFFNPVLDEKKRVQKFQAETAREICKKGYHVFRFDYYASGDSQGELYEFEFDQAISDIRYLIDYFKSAYNISKFSFLGVRLAADLCLLMGSVKSSVSDIFLIEPVVKGKRYLTEQRERRKSFYRLNNMLDADKCISIAGLEYEDFQGFPMSSSVVHFLESLNSDTLVLEGKKIILFKLNAIFSKKVISNLIENVSRQNNEVKVEQINCHDFWASLEPVDTRHLTEAILKYL